MERHLVLRNEQHFFEVIHTTSDLVEAEDMLRRARTAIIAEKNELDAEIPSAKKRVAIDNGIEINRLNLLLTYITDEIRALNKRQDRIRIKEAIKALFGDEGWGRFAAYTHEQICKTKPGA